MSLLDFMDESSELVMEAKTVTEDDIKKIKDKVNGLKDKKYAKGDYIKDVIHETFSVLTISFSTGWTIGSLPTIVATPIITVGGIIGTIISVIISKITEPKTKLKLLNQTMSEISKLIKVANKTKDKVEGKEKEKIEKYINELKAEKEKCANEIEKVQKQIQVSNFDESFASLFEEKTEVDYAPVNEPIEGEDIDDLPEEKQPDYVPNGYGKGDPKDNSTTESSLSNFDDNYFFNEDENIRRVEPVNPSSNVHNNQQKSTNSRNNMTSGSNETENSFEHILKDKLVKQSTTTTDNKNDSELTNEFSLLDFMDESSEIFEEIMETTVPSVNGVSGTNNDKKHDSENNNTDHSNDKNFKDYLAKLLNKEVSELTDNEINNPTHYQRYLIEINKPNRRRDELLSTGHSARLK